MANFPVIQPGGQGGDGGNVKPPVREGKDFFDADHLGLCRDDGEIIQLFLKTAERADVPLKAIEELLKLKDEFFLTMGLQSFGYLTNPQIKAQLANLNYIEGLDELSEEEIYELVNPDDYKYHSKRIHEKLCQEAQLGSDVTRLSAAWAIQELKYPRSSLVRFLSKPAKDIQSQIISENLSRLNDKYLLNNPVKYKEYINFWVYAPKEHLLELLKSIPTNYQNVVESILARLGVPGVKFVTLEASSLRKFVVQAGLSSADSLFRDSKYQDRLTQNELSNLVIPFLDNNDIDLRRLAAQPLNEVGSWLNNDIRAKAAVISRDWNGNVVGLGEVSIPFLRQALRGLLILDTTANVSAQVKAVRCIDQIYAFNVDKKVTTLAEFLQHPEQIVRDATVSLLKPYQDRLEQKSRYIFIALDFKLSLLPLNDLVEKLEEVDCQILLAQKSLVEINEKFENAKQSCDVTARNLLEFLLSKQREYSILLDKYIEDLKQLRTRLQNNQELQIKEKQCQIQREKEEKEWQIEREKKELLRFVRTCTIAIIAVAFLPSIVTSIYWTLLGYWNQLSFLKITILFGPFTLLISFLVLVLFSLLNLIAGTPDNWLSLAEPFEAFMYGLIGTVIYGSLESIIIRLAMILYWTVKEVNFIIYFVKNRLY